MTPKVDDMFIAKTSGTKRVVKIEQNYFENKVFKF